MRIISALSFIIALPLLAIVKFYQVLISPLLGQNCRFYPSCSHYARQALIEHGAFRGSWLAIKRIVKCNPLHPGGIDNVPSKEESKTCCEKKKSKNELEKELIDSTDVIKKHESTL